MFGVIARPHQRRDNRGILGLETILRESAQQASEAPHPLRPALFQAGLPDNVPRPAERVLDTTPALRDMLAEERQAHPLVPRQKVETEEGCLLRQSRDGYRPLLPAVIEIVVPQLRDVASNAVNGEAEPLRLGRKSAARQQPLVENNFVELHGRNRPGRLSQR